VRFRAYFSQPDRVGEQEGLGNSGLRYPRQQSSLVHVAMHSTLCGNPGTRIRTIQFCVAICVIRGACIVMVGMLWKSNVSLCEI
jgi:hypothetical protein